MHRSRFPLTAMLSMVLLLVPCAGTQEHATITGTVTDRSNAMVTNAEITLTNPATGQVRKTTTNTSGLYLFANVGVGHFTLDAAATGFQKLTKTDIVVNTAQALKEDLTLTVGRETQTLPVDANALSLQAETNEVSTLITGDQVTQLATNGRNVVSLAALGMGVSNNLPAFGRVNALTSANSLSVSGTRSSHDIYLCHGTEHHYRC